MNELNVGFEMRFMCGAWRHESNEWTLGMKHRPDGAQAHQVVRLHTAVFFLHPPQKTDFTFY
jgi:hypothetical protein